jgi:hypothetical protein
LWSKRKERKGEERRPTKPNSKKILYSKMPSLSGAT